MKHLYKVLFAIFFLPLFSIAQSNYKPGYVVTLKGDTLHGYIDYKDWDTNPDAVGFKNNTAGAAKRFTPEEIRFFSVQGLESFQKYSGPISTDLTDINHMSEGKDSSFRIATVFLKVLQKGKRAAMYSFSDNIKTRYFIAESPDYSPVELSYRIYLDLEATTATKGPTVNENIYRRQLLVIASKYGLLTDTLQNSIRAASYAESDILEIVSKINGILGIEYAKKYSAKSKLNWFAGAGININHNSPSPSGNYYGTGGRDYTSYLPQASFGFNIFANPNTGKLMYRVEISVSQSQYKSSYQNMVYPEVPFKSSFNELAFSVTPQIIYNFYNAENFKFFMGVGASLTLYKFSNSYYGPQDTHSIYNNIENNNYYFNTFDNTFMLKAGIQIGHRWIIYANYITNTQTTRAGFFELASVDMQTGLNYLFK